MLFLVLFLQISGNLGNRHFWHRVIRFQSFCTFGQIFFVNKCSLCQQKRISFISIVHNLRVLFTNYVLSIKFGKIHFGFADYWTSFLKLVVNLFGLRRGLYSLHLLNADFIANLSFLKLELLFQGLNILGKLMAKIMLEYLCEIQFNFSS